MLFSNTAPSTTTLLARAAALSLVVSLGGCEKPSGLLYATLDAGTGGGAGDAGDAVTITFGPIAVDGGAVYYVETDSPAPTGNALHCPTGTLLRSPAAGGAPTALATITGSFTAIAVGGGVVYAGAHDCFGEGTLTLTARVVSVPTSGGALTTVAGDQWMVSYMALDAANVYWATHDVNGGQTSEILEASIGGGATTSIAQATDAGGLTVDASALYWARDAYSPNRIDVFAAPLAGGTPSAVATVATSNQSRGVAADTVSFYVAGFDYTTSTTTIARAPRSGGTATVLGAAPGKPACVSTDGAHVYWVALATDPMKESQLNRIAVGGGTTEVMAHGHLECLALDATHVYVTSDDDPSKPVLAIPK